MVKEIIQSEFVFSNFERISLLLLLLHLMMYPTKCYELRSAYSTRKTNIFKCLAKVLGPTDRSLSTDVYIRRLWMKINLMISVGEIQGAAGIWSSLRSPLVRPVGRFRNREDARTLQSQHRQRLLVFLQVGHRTSAAGNFVRLAELHFSICM